MNCYEEKESMYREKELQRVHREGSLKRFCLEEMKCMTLWWKSDLGRGKTKRWEGVLGIQATPKMWGNCITVSSVNSVAQSCLTLCNPMVCSSPGFPVHHQLSEPTQTHVHHVGDAIFLSHPLSSPSPPPSIFPSIRVFSNESVLRIRWPKYWSFSFSISPSNEYLGLISFRMDCLDLLAVQGTLKSLLQNHSSKASILQHSAFFIVQLSIRDYWKNHSLG